MKRLAVVAGGWHFPLHFYKALAEQKVPEGWEVDLFCVSHRNPKFSAEEKKEVLANMGNSLRERIDKKMYEEFATPEKLRALGWHYSEEPNTIGDWGITNQWLEKHDYKQYDKFLFTHDDNFIPTDTLFVDTLLREDWLILTNSDGHTSRRLRRYLFLPKELSIRGSFEFFTREMMDMLGGSFDMSRVLLSREGKVTSAVKFEEISDWNNTVTPLLDFIKAHHLRSRIHYLSRYYRMSRYCFEGERGFISSTDPLNTKEENKGLEAVRRQHRDL